MTDAETHGPLADDVRSAVGAVLDPELRRPLAELGMIGAVSVAASATARIELKLTIAGCPAAVAIEREVREAALSVAGVNRVDVDVRVMTPDERSALLSQLRPGGSRAPQFGADSLTRIIAVTSGKGGVGKSTVTANLAASWAAEGLNVGVLDADVYGFSLPALFGLTPDGVPVRPTRLDDMIVPPVAHEVKVISIGMFVEDTSVAVAWRGPMLQRTISQFLSDVYFGDLDVLLLDLPPGTGDVAITVGQLLPHSEVLIVTSPQVAASDVAIRAGKLAQQTGQKILGVVENMTAGSIGGQQVDLFGSGGADAVAQGLSTSEQTVPVLAQVPLSVALREGGDAGVPAVLSAEADPASQALRELARSILHSGPSRAGKKLPLSPR